MASTTIMKEAIGAKTKELLRSQTIDKITVNQICEELDITRKTFYRYFKDKYEVVEWIYYHDYFEKMPVVGDWNMWDFFTETARQVYAEKEWFLNAFRTQGQNSFREAFVNLFMPIAMEEYRDCFTSEDMEQFFIKNTLNMAFDAYEKWFTQSSYSSIDEFLEEFKPCCQQFYALSSGNLKKSIDRDVGK